VIYFLPIVCGVLGWLTNWIAIRSLFRPRTERRVFGARVPFTPGLLVRKQSDIAGKLGEITGREFLDGDRLCEYVFRRIGLSGAGGFTAVLARDLLGRALADLDLGRLVEERLNSLDPASLEVLIYEAMRRELRYIEYLGGLIGFAVGTVQMVMLK
jgi:uncharacterized membrane protein YheB (UPF0754 family)